MATATKLVREAQVESYLVQRVKARGGLCLKWVSPGRVAVPDRIVIIPELSGRARIAFVEVKAPGKRPTQLQSKFLEMLRLLGCNTAWVSTHEEVDTFIEACA